VPAALPCPQAWRHTVCEEAVTKTKIDLLNTTVTRLSYSSGALSVFDASTPVAASTFSASTSASFSTVFGRTRRHRYLAPSGLTLADRYRAAPRGTAKMSGNRWMRRWPPRSPP
jgi:hypothetical protein